MGCGHSAPVEAAAPVAVAAPAAKLGPFDQVQKATSHDPRWDGDSFNAYFSVPRVVKEVA